MTKPTSQTRAKPQAGDRITREFTLDRRAIDMEARTVDLAFASENPVERGYGYEVLQCKPGNVRLDRINQGGALLCNHDWGCQIGVVDRAACGPDGKTRATVRFSRSAMGEECFRDVQDGIRQLVSVGYIIHAVEERTEANVTTYTVTDWEPYEISLVSVPADVSVGVGRSFHPQHEESPMTDKPDTTEIRIPAPVVDINDIAAKARASERERTTRIMKIAAQFRDEYPAVETQASALAENPNATADTLMDWIVAERDKRAQKPITDLNMPRREMERYSLMRAINASLTKDWSKAGLELEASRTIADRLGKEARGFFVPFDVLNDAGRQQMRQRAMMQQRTMSVGSDAAGGFLVDVENMYEYGVWIDALRAQALCLSLGATVLDGLVGDISIPRKTGAATFFWVGEDEAPTDSELALGAVNLRNRTIAGSVPMTRKLLQQTSRAVEMMVRQDMILGAALGIDKAILQGAGGKEPLGIYNSANVGTSAVSTDGAPTWAETVALESALATANALAGNLAYLATPATRGSMKTTAKASNQAIFIWSDDNTVNGYPAYGTTQLPANGLVFGDWSSVIVGFWGVLDLKPDESTKASSGGLVLRVFQDADVGLRHPEAFCYGT